MDLTLFAFLTLVFAISFLFCLISLKRLYSYIRAHRFDESQYTLLLGFIHMRWITWVYMLGVLAIGLFSIFTLLAIP